MYFCRCGISSFTDDCVQVVTDGKRRNDGVYDGNIVNLNTPVREEIKDGQWLGVTVSSQGRQKYNFEKNIAGSR